MTSHSPDYSVSHLQLEGRSFTLNMAAAVLGSWVGPGAGLGGLREISHPPGFDPLTVQHVASRCTD